MSTINHGTTRAYSTHGCRCDPCRTAAMNYQRQRRAHWAAVGPPPWARHGDQGTYTNYSCRCEACTEVNRVARRDCRARRKARAS